MDKQCWVMQILGQPGIGVEAEGDYFLQDFDVDAFDGIGGFDGTHDINLAMKFASPHDVMLVWRSQSTVMPIRLDGRDNRPLTALTITPRKVDK